MTALENRTLSQEELKEIGVALLRNETDLCLRLGGGSMFPILRNGDLGIVEQVAVGQLSVGDVVVFRTATKWIAHRLLSIERTDNGILFVCKGDSQWRTDAPFPIENYMGRITQVLRSGRKIDLTTGFYRMMSRVVLTFPIFTARLFSIMLSFNRKWDKRMRPFRSS